MLNFAPLNSVKECLQFRKDFWFSVGLPPPPAITHTLSYMPNFDSNPIGMFSQLTAIGSGRIAHRHTQLSEEHTTGEQTPFDIVINVLCNSDM